MKVACDFCEKVIDKDNSDFKKHWKHMILGNLEYLICKECSEKLFHYIDIEKGYRKDDT